MVHKKRCRYADFPTGSMKTCRNQGSARLGQVPNGIYISLPSPPKSTNSITHSLILSNPIQTQTNTHHIESSTKKNVTTNYPHGSFELCSRMVLGKTHPPSFPSILISLPSRPPQEYHPTEHTARSCPPI